MLLRKELSPPPFFFYLYQRQAAPLFSLLGSAGVSVSEVVLDFHFPWNVEHL